MEAQSTDDLLLYLSDPVSAVPHILSILQGFASISGFKLEKKLILSHQQQRQANNAGGSRSLTHSHLSSLPTLPPYLIK